MFAGAFLYAVTAGRDFKWAAELANESAARVVGQFGPRLDAIEFDSIKAKFGDLVFDKGHYRLLGAEIMDFWILWGL